MNLKQIIKFLIMLFSHLLFDLNAEVDNDLNNLSIVKIVSAATGKAALIEICKLIIIEIIICTAPISVNTEPKICIQLDSGLICIYWVSNYILTIL